MSEIADYTNIDAIEVIRVFAGQYFKVRLGTMDRYGQYTFKPEPIPYKFKEINSDASIVIEPPSKLEAMKSAGRARVKIYQRAGRGMKLIVTRDANDTYLNLYNM